MQKERGDNEGIWLSRLDIRYYIIQTGVCTDEDIGVVLDQYELYFAQSYLSINSKTYTHMKVHAYITCGYVMQLYGNIDRAINMKQLLSNELENELSAFLSDDDKSN